MLDHTLPLPGLTPMSFNSALLPITENHSGLSRDGQEKAPPGTSAIPGSNNYRNPITAAALSMIFPGLGQFYNGRIRDGILVWLCVGTGILLAVVYPMLTGLCLLIALGTWVSGIADAFRTAKRITAGDCIFTGTSPLLAIPAILLLSAAMTILLVTIFSAVSP
jgi:TM2 domain-containing membrane protein YozV